MTTLRKSPKLFFRTFSELAWRTGTISLLRAPQIPQGQPWGKQQGMCYKNPYNVSTVFSRSPCETINMSNNHDSEYLQGLPVLLLRAPFVSVNGACWRRTRIPTPLAFLPMYTWSGYRAVHTAETDNIVCNCSVELYLRSFECQYGTARINMWQWSWYSLT